MCSQALDSLWNSISTIVRLLNKLKLFFPYWLGYFFLHFSLLFFLSTFGIDINLIQFYHCFTDTEYIQNFLSFFLIIYWLGYFCLFLNVQHIWGKWNDFELYWHGLKNNIISLCYLLCECYWYGLKKHDSWVLVPGCLAMFTTKEDLRFHRLFIVQCGEIMINMFNLVCDCDV